LGQFRSMKKFFRIFGAFVFFAISIMSFVSFEYWKLLDTDSKYTYAGVVSAISFLVGLLLAISNGQVRISDNLRLGLSITLILVGAEFSFLQWKATSPLNHVLHARGRCESFLAGMLGNHFDDVLKNAQNTCTLRLLHDYLGTVPTNEGEEQVLAVEKLLASESRLNETALVVFLSFYSNLEEKLIEKSGAQEPLDTLKNEFSFAEGAIPILEVYHLKDLFEGEMSSDMESTRMKKLLELSTLGKTLGVFFGRARGAVEAFGVLTKARDHGAKFEAGELTLLGIRAGHIQEGYNRIVSEWQMAKRLQDLNLQDTYPEQYQKVLKEVTFPAF
jgi:hypothetical protein